MRPRISRTKSSPSGRSSSRRGCRPTGAAATENVWLGVSVENSRFTWRAELLKAIPAALRFVSAEPLLGSLFSDDGKRRPLELDRIDWVIVGGESGSAARPMDLEWARELLKACKAAETPFFMKQLGTVVARELGAFDRKGGHFDRFPPELRRREMPLWRVSAVALART